jgi:ABC-type glutathione transport system ATPase component
MLEADAASTRALRIDRRGEIRHDGSQLSNHAMSPKRLIRARAKAMLDDAGFALPLDRDFADLSAADRQLVAIARALANKADLLILDEPTASLSIDESKRLFDVLLRLRDAKALPFSISRTAPPIFRPLPTALLVMRGGAGGRFVRAADRFRRGHRNDDRPQTGTRHGPAHGRERARSSSKCATRGC